MSETVKLKSLRRWNVGVGTAHLVQGLLILALANDFAIPVQAKVQDGPPGTPLTIDRIFFDVRFSYAIAAFLFLAAADHLLMASPRVVDWYEANLRHGINYARWAEYSLSASVMIVLIAMLTGITNLYAVVGLFAVNAAMILFGLLMERSNPPGGTVTWWPFGFGCLVGMVPWVAIGIALIAAETDGSGAPGFVYAIFVSLFLLFNCFALNQWLQYRGKGRFADYLYGERTFLILSLVAKTALAWQVYAGTLAD
ncbi:MAG: heliorhodopsin HeR [Acidimicrobiales bacterium]